MSELSEAWKKALADSTIFDMMLFGMGVFCGVAASVFTFIMIMMVRR